MSDPILQHLAAALDLVVLEPQDGGYRAVADLPGWWSELISPDATAGDLLRLDDNLAFLDAFLAEAARFWDSQSGGWFGSGTWQEKLAGGDHAYLEASATCCGGRKILVIKRIDVATDERIALLQRGRANKLVYEQDLAQRERLEAELRLAKQAAEELNAAKSNFLARMTHELRTPMNGVIGMTDLLLDSNPTPEQEGYLQAVRDSARSLLGIINDILDFSKGEVGHIALAAEPFGLRESVADALCLLTVSAEQKGLALTCEIAADVPHALVGDPWRLRQVIVNLVGNAIKFTEAGSITVLVARQSGADESVQLQFTVRDTGVGIPAEKLDSVFDPFAQATSPSSQVHGTGLGLSIAAQLVELMGGRIWVAKTSSTGTTFTFTARFEVGEQDVAVLPQVVDAPSAESVDSPGSGSFRVLVADDNFINRWLAITIVQKRGHSATAVASGEEAVAAVERERFDVVLMDCQMPGMDGLEAAAAIRRQEQATGGHVPIVAVTAQGSDEDRERTIAAGMDAYITKPLDAKELTRLIAELTIQERGKNSLGN